MEEEIYIGSNKLWDDWLEANPNLVNLDINQFLIFAPIRPYPFGWVEVSDD